MITTPRPSPLSPARSQDRKTIIYKDFVSDGTAMLRPGIQRLIDETWAIPVGTLVTILVVMLQMLD